MIIRSAKVPLSPSSALQTMYLRGPGASATVRHLIPVGKPAPPRPRRPDATTSSMSAAGPMLERALQPGQSAVRAIVVQEMGVGDPAPGESQSGLPLEEGMSSGLPDAHRVRTAFEQSGREQARDILGVDRPVADAALRGLRLHQGFQLEQAARAVADDLDVQVQRSGVPHHRRGHLVGAYRHGRRVYRNEHSHSPASAIIASSFDGVRRATGFPSIIPAGPQAHKPRQNVCSSVTRPSAEVSP